MIIDRRLSPKKILRTSKDKSILKNKYYDPKLEFLFKPEVLKEGEKPYVEDGNENHYEEEA